MTFNINIQARLLPPTNVAQIAAQMRAQLQGVAATINVNVSAQGQRALNNVSGGLKNTAKNAKGAQSAIKSFGESAAFAAKRFLAFSIATTAFIKFAGVLKEATAEAISFQRELIKISQVTGSSLTNLGALSNEITRLSSTLGVSSKKLLEASRILAQTGLTAKQTEQALQALAKSDLAPTFDNIINTTEGSIAIFRQFGIEARELESALGSINAVSGKFAVESSDIIAAVRRTGGAFAASGGDLNQLIALFTSVRSTTRESAESIATGFRTIFTRLQRVRTQNFLETLGIQLRDLKGQFVGPYEAVRRLSEALTNLPGTDPRFAKIIEELGGFRQVSKVIPLITEFGTAEKALGVAMGGTTSLSQDAITAQQSLAVQMQKTREQFVAMIRSFTDTSSFQNTIKLILRLANALVKVADALEPLAPLLGVLATISIARLVPGAYAGIKQAGGLGLSGRHDGGVVRRFARGGIVPGVGNKDTVPAKLTPGEYVLRKSAVNKIGVENLQHLNSGGPAYGGVFLYGSAQRTGRGEARAKKSGIAGSALRGGLTNALEQRGKSLSEYDLLYNSKPVSEWPFWDSKNVAVESRFGYLGENIRGQFAENVRKRTKDMMKASALEIGGGVTKVENEDFVNGIDAIQGHVFEGAMTRLGDPFDATMTDQNRPMDFPNGLPATLAKTIVNHGELMGIPVDAKRSEQAKDEIKSKYIKELADALKADQTYQGFSLKKKEKIVAPQGRASGGQINQPNAILTPGEFVVNKDDASRMGVNKLDYINRTGQIPGMASGGAYGQIFKPQLTGRGIAPGNVGRKKQYYTQLISFLEKGKTDGLLGAEDLKMLGQLKLRVSAIQQSRTARFGKRFGFAKGGSFGRVKSAPIKRYATGGAVTRGGGMSMPQIGMAIAGLSAFTSTIEGLDSSFKYVLSIVTALGSQFAVLMTVTKTTIGTIGRFDEKIAKADAERQALIVKTQPVSKRIEKTRKLQDTINTRLADPTLTPQKRQKLQNLQTRVGSKLVERVDARDALRAEASQRKDTILANRKLQAQTQHLAIGLGIASVALGQFASYLEKAGRAKIEAGGSSSDFVAAKTLGGASSAANIGAIAGGAIGALVGVGPIIGGIIGGIGAAIIGGIVGWFNGNKEAFDIKAMTDFNKTLSEGDRILKAIQSGQTKYSIQFPKLQQDLSKARESLYSGLLGDAARQDIFAGIKGQTELFEGALSDAAKRAKTFEEFRDIVSPETLRNFSDLFQMPYSELEAKYRQQIQTQNEAVERTKKIIAVQDEYGNQIKSMLSLSRAFNDVALTMQRFDNATKGFVEFAQGATGSFRVTDESARLGSPDEFFNPDRFNKILNRDIANNPALQTTFPKEDDTIGRKFAKDVADAEKAVRSLPIVMLSLRDNIASLDGDQVMERLLKGFDGSSDLVRNSIQTAAQNWMGDAADTTQIINEIQRNPLEAAKKLGEGFKPIFETAAKISKATSEEANRRLEYIDQLSGLLKTEMELRSRSIEIEEQGERLTARTSNRSVDLNKLEQLNNRKVTSLGVGSDPRTIGLKLQLAQNRLTELRNKYTEKELKNDGVLEKEVLKQTNTITKANTALEMLANISDRASVTMEKFEKAQQEATFKRDLLFRAASLETPEQGRQMGLELKAARVAQAKGSITAVPPELRQEVMSFFRDLGERRLGVFGNESGTEIESRLLSDVAQRAGFNPEDAKKLGEGTSSETDKLQKALKSHVDTAKAAIEVIQKNASDNTDRLLTGLNDSIIKFTQELSEILKASKVEQETRALVTNQAGLSDLQGQEKNLQDMVNRFGSEDKAMAVAKNFGLIQEIDALQKAATQLTSFSININDIIDEGTVFNRDNMLLDQLNDAGVFNHTNGVITREGFESTLSKIGKVILKSSGDQGVTDDVIGAIRKRVTFGAEMGEKNNEISMLRFNALLPKALQDIIGGVESRYSSLTPKYQDLTRNLGFSLSEEDTAFLTGASEATEEGRKKYVAALSIQAESLRTLSTRVDSGASAFDQLNKEMAPFATEVNRATASLRTLGISAPAGSQRGGLIGFNKGGVVPGSGNRDTVPALLTPGETVIPKYAKGGLIEDIQKKMLNAQQAKRVANEEYVTKYNAAGGQYDSVAIASRNARDEQTAKHTKTIEDARGQFKATYKNKEYTDRAEYLNATSTDMMASREARINESLSNLSKRAGSEAVEVKPTVAAKPVDPEILAKRAKAQAAREAKQAAIDKKLGRKSYAERNPAAKLGSVETLSTSDAADYAEYLGSGPESAFDMKAFKQFQNSQRAIRLSKMGSQKGESTTAPLFSIDSLRDDQAKEDLRGSRVRENVLRAGTQQTLTNARNKNRARDEETRKMRNISDQRFANRDKEIEDLKAKITSDLDKGATTSRGHDVNILPNESQKDYDARYERLENLKATSQQYQRNRRKGPSKINLNKPRSSFAGDPDAFWKNGEAERQRIKNRKFNTESTAPTSIMGILGELGQGYKIGERAANVAGTIGVLESSNAVGIMSDSTRDAVMEDIRKGRTNVDKFGLGTVAKFAGEGMVGGAALGAAVGGVSALGIGRVATSLGKGLIGKSGRRILAKGMGRIKTTGRAVGSKLSSLNIAGGEYLTKKSGIDQASRAFDKHIGQRIESGTARLGKSVGISSEPVYLRTPFEGGSYKGGPGGLQFGQRYNNSVSKGAINEGKRLRAQQAPELPKATKPYGPLTQEETLYPKSLATRQKLLSDPKYQAEATARRAERTVKAQEDSLAYIREMRQGSRPQGTKRITGGQERELLRLRAAGQKHNIDPKYLPDEIKIVDSAEDLQKYATQSGASVVDRITEGTRGIAIKNNIGLRMGAPEDIAFHEWTHIIDRKRAIAQGLTEQYASHTAKAKELLKPIRSKLLELTSQGAYDPDYGAYLATEHEIVADLGRQILSGRGNRYTDMVRRVIGFQSGAFVPGVGAGDKIHALLEPGEFVLNRNAVKAAGPQNLNKFNNKHSRFQTGGAVGMQEGGAPAAMAMPDFTMLNEIVQNFGNKVDLFAESLNNINGMEIQLVANHKVEVIINGAQVLQQLEPSIQELIISQTNQAINSMLKSKFPDVGTM